MRLHHIGTAYLGDFEHAQQLNAELLAGFARHADDPDNRRTHCFRGRCENLYIDVRKIPVVRQVLDNACAAARSLLRLTGVSLRTGFWFNAMPPGTVTLPHNHDEEDELLAAVYYVHVPENSGELILYAPEGPCVVAPRAGQFVFFAPTVMHEVSENRSSEVRLSIGINIGHASANERVRDNHSRAPDTDRLRTGNTS